MKLICFCSMKIESNYLSFLFQGLNQKPGFVGRLILKVPKFKAYFYSCSMDRKENPKRLNRLKSLQQGQFEFRRLDLCMKM